MSVPGVQHNPRVEDLDYDLPPDLIAIRPAEPRDAARMLVVRRSSCEVEHRLVRDLPEYLNADDALVFNTTTVVPARIHGLRQTGGSVEGLYVGTEPGDGSEVRWRAMLKAGGRLRVGERIDLLDESMQSSGHSITLLSKIGAHWMIRPSGGDPAEILQQIGRTPLPPYIIKARGRWSPGDPIDRGWYQTVYADPAKAGSVAAPTAGLHFTPGLLGRLRAKGVRRIDVTLHVGPGTFRPVTAPTLAEHHMHSEWFEVGAAAMEQLRHPTGRIIAVGTTSVRTLESLPSDVINCGDVAKGPVGASENCGGVSGMTDLLIAPPHEFRLVHGMLTNFHLPRSTLLALVAAMVGLERLKEIYRLAVGRKYRFYSFGDAMLVLP